MDIGGDDVMLRVGEGKLVTLTQYVPTLRMERIPMAMQEHVVRVPLSWLFLLRRVTRAVLCYREFLEAVMIVEVEDHP